MRNYKIPNDNAGECGWVLGVERAREDEVYSLELPFLFVVENPDKSRHDGRCTRISKAQAFGLIKALTSALLDLEMEDGDARNDD